MTTPARFTSLPLLLAGILMLIGCGSPSDPVLPETPTSQYDVVSVTSTHGFALDIAVDGDSLYVAENWAGLAVYDISDLEAITFSRSAQASDEVRLVNVVPEVNAILANTPDKTLAYFMDELDSPPGSGLGDRNVNAILTQVVFDTVTSKNMMIPDTFQTDVIRAFVADQSDGLQVFTVFRDSSDIIPGQEYALFAHDSEMVIELPGNESGVAAVGSFNLMAVSALDLGVYFVDTSPATWESDGVLLGNVDTPGEATNLVFDAGYLYVADGEGGLAIIDATTPSAPTFLTSWREEGFDHVINVAVQGSVLAVVDEFDGVVFLDISDPASPELIDTYTVRRANNVVFLDDETLIISSEIEGLTVLRLVL